MGKGCDHFVFVMFLSQPGGSVLRMFWIVGQVQRISSLGDVEINVDSFIFNIKKIINLEFNVGPIESCCIHTYSKFSQEQFFTI